MGIPVCGRNGKARGETVFGGGRASLGCPRQARLGVFLLVLALALLGSASALFAADTAETVRRSSKAAANVTYEATWTVQESGADGRTTQALYHEVWDGPSGRSRIDYTSPSSLAGTMVLDDGRRRVQYDPKTGQAVRQASGRRVLLDRVESKRLDLLTSNYGFNDAGTGEIAGRSCWIVETVPRSAGNPSRRLWVDRYTWLPLRTETWSSSGDLIRSSETTQIRFNPSVSDETFSLPAAANVTDDPYVRIGPLEISDAASQAGFRPREPRYLPAGYVFAGAHVLRSYQSVAIHIRYFDGLSTLSLFEKPSGEVQSPEWGGHVLLALSWADGKLAFTLIGGISSDELQRIQQSLR